MNATIRALLLCPLLALVAGCDDTAKTVAGGSDETHSGISLVGSIFTDRSTPYAGMVVRLRHTALVDTTDARGAYRLLDADTVLAASATPACTVDVWREGRMIHSEAVGAWIDSVPTIYLTQRDISGKLVGDVGAVRSVVALFGDARTDTLDLEWNPVLGSYSGFSYFPWDGNLNHYQVRIEVRDSLRRLVGRSVDIPFTSRAGDIEVPTFAAGNARPRLRLVGPDTATSRTLLVLQAFATDSFGQKVTVKWKEIPDGGIPEPGSDHLAYGLQKSTDTLVRWYMPSGRDSTLVFHCTATDEDGLTVQDSLVVRRNPSPPSVYIQSWVYGDSARLRFSAGDVAGGKIVQYRLYRGYQEVDESAKSASCVIIDTSFIGTAAGLGADTSWTYSSSSSTGGTPVQSPCGEPVITTKLRFVRHDTGVIVSGKDTAIWFPPVDSQGRMPMVALRVVDGDGEASVAVSNPFHRSPGPDSLSWTIVPLDSTQSSGYRMDVRFRAVNDTFSIGVNRVVRIPWGWNAKLRTDGGGGVQTVSGSTAYDNGSVPVLSFIIPGPQFTGCLEVIQDFESDTSVPTSICSVGLPATQ
jgi:hypothetical protein